MRFESFISAADSTSAAAKEVVEAARGSGIKPDVAFVFFSADHAELAEELIRQLREGIAATVIVGCSAEGVIGGDIEIEREPGLSIMLAEIPGVRVEAFHIPRDDWRDLLSNPQELRSRIGYQKDTRAIIGFGDPFTTPLTQLMTALDELAPNAPLIGGMASSARGPGENVLVLNDQNFNDGFVGVSLSGPIEVETLVSQGCRPIGRPMVITKAHENFMDQLGGKPALQVLRAMVEELSTEDRSLLENGLLIGRAISEFRERFARGDFLVRNIIGVDKDTGAIALADLARVGQTVQFHVRDAATADEDLQLMLEVQKVDDSPAGALLFSCNGRGTRLFEETCHDIGVARRAMPTTAVAGFFAAGEIGPVGGKNFIHGHTASFALFRPERTA
jgi:small ligand-binding sensory domain FIST